MISRNEWEYNRDNKLSNLSEQIDEIKAELDKQELEPEKYTELETELDELQQEYNKLSDYSYDEAKADNQYDNWKSNREDY